MGFFIVWAVGVPVALGHIVSVVPPKNGVDWFGAFILALIWPFTLLFAVGAFITR